MKNVSSALFIPTDNAIFEKDLRLGSISPDSTLLTYDGDRPALFES